MALRDVRRQQLARGRGGGPRRARTRGRRARAHLPPVRGHCAVSGETSQPHEESPRASEVRTVREELPGQELTADASLHPRGLQGVRLPALRQALPVQKGHGGASGHARRACASVLLRVRPELQEPHVLQSAHEVQPETRRPRQAQVRVHSLRQEVPEGVPPAGAQPGRAPEGHAHLLLRAAVQLCVLVPGRAAHAPAHGAPRRSRRTEPRVRCVREGLHEQEDPGGPPALAHGRATLPVRALLLYVRVLGRALQPQQTGARQGGPRPRRAPAAPCGRRVPHYRDDVNVHHYCSL